MWTQLTGSVLFVTGILIGEQYQWNVYQHTDLNIKADTWIFKPNWHWSVQCIYKVFGSALGGNNKINMVRV